MKKNILIIEDDKALGEGLRIILEDEGYEASLVSNGASLSKTLEMYKPDLLLIDYRLPGKDGASISKDIKKRDSTKRLPIILMSASQDNMLQISKDAKVDAFIPKPFIISDLLETIENQFLKLDRQIINS